MLSHIQKRAAQIAVLVILFLGLVASVVYIYLLFKNEQYGSSRQLFMRLCNRKRVETLQQFKGGATILTAMNQYAELTRPTAEGWDRAAATIINRGDWQISTISECRYYRTCAESPVKPVRISRSTGAINVTDCLVIVNAYAPNAGFKAVGLNYYTDAVRYRLIQEAKKAKDMRILPVVSEGGYRSLLFFGPTFVGGRFVGGVTGLYQEDVIIPDRAAEDIQFRVTVDGVTLIEDAGYYASVFFTEFRFTFQNVAVAFSCSAPHSAPLTAEAKARLERAMAIADSALTATYAELIGERDRLAERVDRLEEEVRQLRGGGEGGGSRRA